VKPATGVDGALAGDMIPARDEFSARIIDGQNGPMLTQAYRSTWNVFQSEAFLAAVQRHIVAGSDKLVLVGVIDRAGDPVAVFPFVKRKRYGIAVLEALDFGITDMFAPTFFRNQPLSAEATKAVWRTAVNAVPGVHAVSFMKMPRAVHKKPHALSGADFVKSMHASATTLFLQDGAGAANPATLARKLKKAAKPLKLADLSFEEARTREDIDACLTTLVDFRTRRFEQLARYDALLDPNVVAFYRMLADRSTDESRPGRIFSLRAGAEIIAIAYGFAYRGAFTMIAPAITPKKEFQAGSPGIVVMYKTLEWCLREKYEVFDLSVGSLSYKSNFEADSIELFEHQEAITPLGLPVVLDGWLRRWIRDKARTNPKLRSAMERLRRVRSGKVRENA
jgi:CelD/BcsL family acetyltransferase involved in cellulose biosynthesis